MTPRETQHRGSWLRRLGGSELNYFSDIDLIFLYGKDGETDGGARGNPIHPPRRLLISVGHLEQDRFREPVADQLQAKRQAVGRKTANGL